MGARQTSGPVISAEDLHALIRSQKVVVLYTQMADPASGELVLPAGYIEGSVLVDFERDFVDAGSDLPHTLPDTHTFTSRARAKGLHPNQHFVVYDAHGIYCAARVWWMFKAFGFANIQVLDGGLPAWQQAGYPLVDTCADRAPEPLAGLDAPVTLSPLFCDASAVQQVIDGHAQAQVIDARSAARFRGKAPEPRAGVRSGHMPGALNLPFTELLTEGRLKPEADLRSCFNNAGIDLQKPMVFSCGSGVTACILAMAAYALGARDLRVYDGSWSEWGRDSSRPVVCP